MYEKETDLGTEMEGKCDEMKDEVEKKSDTFLCMDREMIPCKLIFFIMDMSWSCGFSFMSLFYIEAGLTVDKLGLSDSIGSIVSLFIFPLWGLFVDSLKRNRILFITIMVLATAAIEFSKPWVVMVVSQYETSTQCVNVTSNVTHSFIEHQHNRLEQLPKPFFTMFNNLGVRPQPPMELIGTTVKEIFNMSSNITRVNTTQVCHTVRKLVNPDILFYAVATNGLISALLSRGMMAYMETAIMKTVFTREKSYSYGEQKVFGPIGYAVGSLMAGVAVDHFHPKYLSKYIITFFMYVPVCLLQLPLLFIITRQADWNYGKQKKEEKKVSPWRDIYNTFKKPDNLVFLVSVVFSGLSLSVIYTFLYIYVDGSMHPSKTMLSLYNVVSMGSELLIYPLSSKLINFVGGSMRCVLLGIFSTALRLWLLCQCTQPWHILLIQPLHGIGMSLGWTSMIEHCWAIFPKEITTTAIGILMSLHWVAPGIATSIIGGQLYHRYGGPPIFHGMSYIGASWCVVMLIYMSCCNHTSPELPSQKCDQREGKEREEHDEVDKVEGVNECGTYKGIELDEVVCANKL